MILYIQKSYQYENFSKDILQNQAKFIAPTAYILKRLRDILLQSSLDLTVVIDAQIFTTSLRVVKLKVKSKSFKPQIKAQTSNDPNFTPQYQILIVVQYKAIICQKQPIFNQFYQGNMEPVWHHRAKNSAKGNFG